MPIRSLAAVALLLAAPALADPSTPYDLAISRLRACASAGASNAPNDSLGNAIVAVRSLCRPQIDTAYLAADRRIAASNPRAADDRLAKLRKQARRGIDYDLALLVSKSTGLQP